MRSLLHFLRSDSEVNLRLSPQGEPFITEQGFLALLRLFLTRDRAESCWVMLHALGWV